MKDKTFASMDDALTELAEYSIELFLNYGLYWYEILREIGDTVTKIVVNGEDVELPYNLGHLTAITKNQDLVKKPKVNIVATKLLWKERPDLKEQKKYLYYINDDLTYNSFRWIRNKKSSLVRYIKYYKIFMVRSAKQMIAQGGTDGIRYANKRKVV